MRSRCSEVRSELGAVTAELAAALPAAVLVVLLAIGGVGAAAQQVRLQDAAGDAARAAARGDDPAVYTGIASLELVTRGELLCATVSDAALGGLVQLRASSCADAGGR